MIEEVWGASEGIFQTYGRRTNVHFELPSRTESILGIYEKPGENKFKLIFLAKTIFSVDSNFILKYFC